MGFSQGLRKYHEGDDQAISDLLNTAYREARAGSHHRTSNLEGIEAYQINDRSSWLSQERRNEEACERIIRARSFGFSISFGCIF